MSCYNKQYSTIQFRRGLNSDFVANNVVLASGEPAYSIDTKVFKVGDGVSTWSQLSPPFGIDSSGTVINPGNNKVLTSDGTINGIYGENNLLFDSIKSELQLDGTLIVNSSGARFGNNNIGFVHFIDQNPNGLGFITNSGYPLAILNSGGFLYGGNSDINGILYITHSGNAVLGNAAPNYRLNVDGKCFVDDGLVAPTPITDLGPVSGNVPINYDINKQIQLINIATSGITNFTQGAGWSFSPKTPGVTSMSVDVVLQIQTVMSSTSVLWDVVDDWYNQPPPITSGQYIVLLRSLNGTTIQGHYIGTKTN